VVDRDDVRDVVLVGVHHALAVPGARPAAHEAVGPVADGRPGGDGQRLAVHAVGGGGAQLHAGVAQRADVVDDADQAAGRGGVRDVVGPVAVIDAAVAVEVREADAGGAGGDGDGRRAAERGGAEA